MFANTYDDTNIPLNLRDSEDKYRLLVENVNDSIVISQKDKFVYFNRQFADLLGYQSEELLMIDYRRIYSEKSLKVLSERDQKRKKNQEVPSRYETVFIRKDGSEVCVEANVTIVDYMGEKATFAVIRDITPAKLAEKELAEKDQRYRLLFELSPTGLLLEDLDGIILDVNPAFCQSLGYTKEELIGQHVDILVHPDVLDQVAENINELKKGKVLKHQEKSLRKNGSICYMELHESKITLPEGKEGILCIAHDVTDKLSAEEDRIQKERMKGVLEMAGAVCHELNQPMTVVSVNSEMRESQGACHGPNEPVPATVHPPLGRDEQPVGNQPEYGPDPRAALPV